MGDIDGECEGLGCGARDNFRFRLSVRCTGKIGLPLELGLWFNARVSARLRFRITVRCG